MGTNPKSIELYEKLGGYGQALRDFQSAKFTSVRKDVNRVPHLQIENFKVEYRISTRGAT